MSPMRSIAARLSNDREATLEDLEGLPDTIVGEIIDGVLMMSPRLTEQVPSGCSSCWIGTAPSIL